LHMRERFIHSLLHLFYSFNKDFLAAKKGEKHGS